MVCLSNRHHWIIFEILYHYYVGEELYFVATSIVSDLIDGEKVGAKVRNMKYIFEDTIFQLNIAFTFYVNLSIIAHIDVWYIWRF